MTIADLIDKHWDIFLGFTWAVVTFILGIWAAKSFNGMLKP